VFNLVIDYLVNLSPTPLGIDY